MYIAQTATSNNDKIIASIVTSVLLLGTYFLLQFTGLPNVKQKTETYDEINWTRFKPKPQKITPASEPVTPPKIEQTPKFEQPLPAPKPVQRIDLSALKSQFETITKPSPALSARQNKTETKSASLAPAQVDLKQAGLLGGLNTLLGEPSKKFKLSTTGSKGRSLDGGSQMALGKGTAMELGNGNTYGGSIALGAPEGKDTHDGSIEIGMVDIGQMAADFADLSPVYHALIEWMKSHHADFPEVVARFMEKSSGDLTSIVEFQIQGRAFTMYLMCKENLFEVRICLVEGDQSTFLIDRGFKEKSRYLRIGSVNKTTEGSILSFGTTRKAASDGRAIEFYRVFLSWWESVK